jgi:putative DNA primase/helicase
MAVATEVVENSRAHETYEVLGWKEPSVNYQTRKPHDFGSLLAFKNEDGTTFQAKPERPRTDEKGKVIKYETPKDNGSRAFLPPVDAATRQKIAEVQGVEVPLDGSFWDWVAANPQLTKIPTEGPGKALALLSVGYIAIGLTGVNGGFQSNEKDPTTGLKTKLEAPKLITDLPRFLGADSPIVLAFDADTNPNTADTVNAAMRRFGRLIEDSGAVVSIASWHGKGGKTKGVDDLIAADGVAAWEKALAGALSLAEWQAKHRKISPLTYLNAKGEVKLKPPSKVVAVLSEAWADRLAYNDTTKTFWQYGAEFVGLWTERSEDVIRSTIQQALDHAGAGYGDAVSTIYKLLKGKLIVTKWGEQLGVTPMRNGVLDNTTLELAPHSPTNYLTWQLPYDYNPLATCEPIQEWLEFTQDADADRVQLLRAYLRAIVMGRSDLQRFVELVSTVGGSGKTTFCNLAIALVGIENCHVTSSSQLEQSRFETACFKGKRLIYFADGDRYSGDKAISMLKRITGSEPIPYERKGKDALAPFYFGGMVLIAANTPVSTTDTAIPRRRITVPFLKAIPQDEQRMLLERKGETLEGEFVTHIPGVLNWVLSMSDAEMARYLKDTDRAVPSLGAVKAETLITVNPMAAWFDSCCVLLPEARTQTGISKKIRHTETDSNGSKSWESFDHAEDWLYPNYLQYCAEKQATNVSFKQFGKLLENLCVDQLRQSEVKRGTDRNGAYFMGVAIRDKSHNHLPCPISGGDEVVAEVGPIEQTPDTADDAALDTGKWDEPEPIPATWQALPQGDRQSAETLLRLLKQAEKPSEIWFNPMQYDFPDRVRQSVSQYLQNSERDLYDRTMNHRGAA